MPPVNHSSAVSPGTPKEKKMAGYSGYSKSNNAVDAESEGRFPMSRARVIVARATGVTQKEAERVLRLLPDAGKEYHHTSKFYNSTDYFDADAAVKVIKYANQTGAPVEAVIEMVEKNDMDILSGRIIPDEEVEKIVCSHVFINVTRDLKKSEGGGRVYSHQRCLTCNFIRV
jgi:hypothetical protein